MVIFMPENDNGSIYFSFTKRTNLNPLTLGWILNVGTYFKVNQLHSNQLQSLRDLFRLEQERITENDSASESWGTKLQKIVQADRNISIWTQHFKTNCQLQLHFKTSLSSSKTN